jgi:hypothetical protein
MNNSAPRIPTQYSVDRLLQLAFLEGEITTRGLYERIALRRPEEWGVDNSVRTATLGKLFREIDVFTQSVPSKTVGEFLRQQRMRHQVSLSFVQRRLAVPGLAYRMIENDSISPLKVPLKTWKRIRDLWKVPWKELEVMIRATHYLTVFRPSYKGTLLRYRKKTGSTYPPDARVSAARELYLRARLPLPARERESIENLLSELKRPKGG